MHPVPSEARIRWSAAFLVFAGLGVLWSLSVPRLGGPDEPAHVVKATAVARGQLQTDVVRSPGGFGMVLPQTEVEVPESYAMQTLWPQLTCWSGKVDVSTACAPDLPARVGPIVRSVTYVGTYQPTYYAVVGWPTRLLPPTSGLLGARVVSALVVAALLASAVVSVGDLGGPILHLGLLLGVSPVVLFLGGVVNPSGVEIAAALALWTALLVLVSDPLASRRAVISASVAAAALMSVRPLSPAFALVILIMVLLLAADLQRLRTLWSRRSIRWAAMTLAGIWLVNVAYVFYTRALSSVITGGPHGDGSALSAAHHALGETWAWLTDQVGLLSWVGFNELHVPAQIVSAWLAMIGVLVMGALLSGPMRRRSVLVLLILGSLAMPVLAQAANPKVGWQGRYSLPLTVGIPIVAGWVVDRSGRVPVRVGCGLLALVGGAVAVVHLVSQQALMSRNLRGFPSPVFAPRDPAVWNGPLTPDLLLALAVVFSIGMAGLCVWTAVSLGRRGSGVAPEAETRVPAAS